MSSTLVVGYDGTPEGDDALALARLLAVPLEGELVAACVKREAREAEDALARASGADLHRVPVEHRSPARGLLQLAEAEGADMLVVGSSHHSGFGAGPARLRWPRVATATRASTGCASSGSDSTPRREPSARSTGPSTWPSSPRPRCA
jgi:hypothetical protein